MKNPDIILLINDIRSNVALISKAVATEGFQGNHHEILYDKLVNTIKEIEDLKAQIQRKAKGAA